MKKIKYYIAYIKECFVEKHLQIVKIKNRVMALFKIIKIIWKHIVTDRSIWKSDTIYINAAYKQGQGDDVQVENEDFKTNNKYKFILNLGGGQYLVSEDGKLKTVQL